MNIKKQMLKMIGTDADKNGIPDMLETEEAKAKMSHLSEEEQQKVLKTTRFMMTSMQELEEMQRKMGKTPGEKFLGTNPTEVPRENRRRDIPRLAFIILVISLMAFYYFYQR